MCERKYFCFKKSNVSFLVHQKISATLDKDLESYTVFIIAGNVTSKSE